MLFQSLMEGPMLDDRSVRLFSVETYDMEMISFALTETLFDFVHPGDRVVLKPNWVRQNHESRSDEWIQIITHPAIISVVLDRVTAQLQGNGRISIVDSPETNSSFSGIMAHYPVEEWKRTTESRGVEFEILDLRDDEWIVDNGVIVERRKLYGDPRGKVNVDLGAKSEFYTHVGSKRGYYGADYHIKEVNRAHQNETHRYSLSRTVMDCDVLINLPKLKTHKKAGITASLKNLVGVNTYKNFLPHYSLGTPDKGGDQFPMTTAAARIESSVYTALKEHILAHPRVAALLKGPMSFGRRRFFSMMETVRSGNWYGNDTLWRMVLDLNKAVLYANGEGHFCLGDASGWRRSLSIVDAVVAGEGEGPKKPDPIGLNRIIVGRNPAAVDAVCAAIMGFDPLAIPVVRNAFSVTHFPITSFEQSEIIILADGREYSLYEILNTPIQRCEPHFGWKGYIEAGQN